MSTGARARPAYFTRTGAPRAFFLTEPVWIHLVIAANSASPTNLAEIGMPARAEPGGAVARAVNICGHQHHVAYDLAVEVGALVAAKVVDGGSRSTPYSSKCSVARSVA
jgi:hypothetical protein